MDLQTTQTSKPNCITSYFIDDHCQYWLNEVDRTLTSPNYGVNDLEYEVNYDHNLNCTWLLTAGQEFYITLEILFFEVYYDNHTNNTNFYNFSYDIPHFSLVMVTIYQFMMDKISNHHKYLNHNNSNKKNLFIVQGLTCWSNL